MGCAVPPEGGHGRRQVRPGEPGIQGAAAGGQFPRVREEPAVVTAAKDNGPVAAGVKRHHCAVTFCRPDAGICLHPAGAVPLPDVGESVRPVATAMDDRLVAERVECHPVARACRRKRSRGARRPSGAIPRPEVADGCARCVLATEEEGDVRDRVKGHAVAAAGRWPIRDRHQLPLARGPDPGCGQRDACRVLSAEQDVVLANWVEQQCVLRAELRTELRILRREGRALQSVGRCERAVGRGAAEQHESAARKRCDCVFAEPCGSPGRRQGLDRHGVHDRVCARVAVPGLIEQSRLLAAEHQRTARVAAVGHRMLAAGARRAVRCEAPGVA